MPEWTLRDRRGPDRVMHASTQGALLAMKELAGIYSFSNILDLGCGSGLLSMVASELWPQARILAADISPEAVADTSANLAAHGLEARVTAVRSDGFAHPDILSRAPYDLILSNLLADLHIRFAAALHAHLQPDGCAVLSGILAWKLPQVREAYAMLGCEITGEIALKQWHALILRRN